MIKKDLTKKQMLYIMNQQKNGNKEAILELATKKPSKYNFNPEEYKTNS